MIDDLLLPEKKTYFVTGQRATERRISSTCRRENRLINDSRRQFFRVRPVTAATSKRSMASSSRKTVQNRRSDENTHLYNTFFGYVTFFNLPRPATAATATATATATTATASCLRSQKLHIVLWGLHVGLVL